MRLSIFFVFLMILARANGQNAEYFSLGSEQQTQSSVETSGQTEDMRYSISSVSRYFEETLERPSLPSLSTNSNPSNQSPYTASIQTGMFATSDGKVPFWMRSRKSGSVPMDGISGSFIGAANRNYETGHFKPQFDWGSGVDFRINAGNDTKVILVEAYLKARLGAVELKGGRFREQIGLVDSTLSSGAFSLSGNALGVPKIELGMNEYWNVPFTNSVLAVKWTVAHGWMGKVRLNKDDDNIVQVDEVNSYWHQKSFYARLGKPNWKVKLYGGFNHQVIWGNENQIYADWNLTKLKTFEYVFIGKPNGTSTIAGSKVGNHIGSIDQAMELNLKTATITGYHQFFYDVGALSKLANVKDGLWGISVKNHQRTDSRFAWTKFLVEFMYSRSQGGELDSKPRPSGAEDYYNNYLYYDGWSYNGLGLGNPFITPKIYTRSGLPTKSGQYFSNNRVLAFHTGADFSINSIQCVVFLSYSSNQGSYLTSPGTRLIGDTYVTFDPPYFRRVSQFSAYLTCRKPLKRILDLSFEFAIDQGDLLYNSAGASLSLIKTW